MTEEELLKRAKTRVENKIGFLNHFTTYICVNIILAGVNFIFSPDSLWFYWVAIAWGIGILWHFVNAMVFANWFEDLRQKWIQKEIEKMK